jgi:cob(I)alamin adenosyltransferase
VNETGHKSSGEVGGSGHADEAASAQVFNEPRLAINRVYTKKGDGGLTGLAGGQRVPKHDLRIEAYGTVDELNAFVGAARQSVLDLLALPDGRQALTSLADTLSRVQHELFNLGSILATLPEDVHPRQPRITPADITRLEEEMDQCQEALAPLRSFVLPGGSRVNTDLHVARTVCRRAERRVVELGGREAVDPLSVAYLNRLSDALFVWSRWAALHSGAEEMLWEPNKAAGGRKMPAQEG